MYDYWYRYKFAAVAVTVLLVWWSRAWLVRLPRLLLDILCVVVCGRKADHRRPARGPTDTAST